MFTSHNKIKYLCDIMFGIGMYIQTLSLEFIFHIISSTFIHIQTKFYEILRGGLWHVSPNSSGALLSVLIVILQLQRTLVRKNYMWQNGI